MAPFYVQGCTGWLATVFCMVVSPLPVHVDAGAFCFLLSFSVKISDGLCIVVLVPCFSILVLARECSGYRLPSHWLWWRLVVFGNLAALRALASQQMCGSDGLQTGTSG